MAERRENRAAISASAEQKSQRKSTGGLEENAILSPS
jgi:hypothetical protein